MNGALQSDYMKNVLTASSKVLLISILCLLVAGSCHRSDKMPAGNKNNTWLEEVTITGLQQGYREGRYTVTEVVKSYLARIDSIDRNGPKLNSVITVNPDAIEIAEELDRESAG